MAALGAYKGVLLSILGGLGSYLQGVRDDRIERGIFNFLTEMTLALALGLALLYLGEHFEVPLPLVYVMVLVLCNNSSDSFNFLRQLVKTAISSKFKLQGK